jgi:general secretion pathway protein B
MSYILDALRKADAERGRGSVPDLHAQLLPPVGVEAEPEPVRSPPLRWIGIGALLAVVAAAAWWALGSSDPAAPPLAAATPAATAVPAAPSAVASAGPAGVAAQTPPAAPEAARPLPAVPPSVPKASAAPKAAASAPAAAARARAKPAAPAPSAPAAAVPAPAPPARLPVLAELPADLRQQVPPLVIGGSVYSPQASVRMVVVNGQVFQEGNSLAPELKLEQVRQKTAVFSIRGQRFEVPL